MMRSLCMDAIRWAIVRFVWLVYRASGGGPISLEAVERVIWEYYQEE